MKKALLFFAVFAFAITSAYSQIIYEENFDSYTAGDYVAVVNPDWWTTWGNDPGGPDDALISDEQSNSPANSVKVEGASDLILKLDDKTNGKYKISFNYYLVDGFGGYYNFQHYESPGIEWAFEVYFGATGSGYLSAGSEAVANFDFDHDSWIPIEQIIDLDNDWTELYIDGNLIYEWPFSWQPTAEEGLLQMGGIDFYAGAPTGETATYFFDDLVYEEVPVVLYSDDMEAYDAGDFLAVEQPDWWTTWGNDPGGPDDTPITDEMAQSGTKSALVEGVTDGILKLGDRTSGVYELNFSYYLPEGFGGYFNIQHFESPGIEWAYEVYFGATGSAYLSAGSEAVANFDFDHDTWISIVNKIDLDEDWTELWVNGTLVYEWPFSWQATAQEGTLQLGGMDLYAGAPTGETAKYYMDDMEFVQVSAGVGSAIINVDPVSLTESVNGGGTSTQLLTIANEGVLDLDYDIFTTYQFDSKSGSFNQKPTTGHSKEVILDLAIDANAKPGGPAPDATDDEVILNYDGDNFSAIGMNNGGEMRVSAMFPANMVNDYIGYELTSIDLFINDVPLGTKIQVYDYGLSNIPGPGEMLWEEDFAAVAGDWNDVNLTIPIPIEGGDIWVGYWLDHIVGSFVPGTDEGPTNPNGDWMSTGPGWGHLSDNPDLQYNWNIRAHLTGDAIEQWLSVSAPTGTVAPGESTDLDVTFDASNLNGGTYNATLVINNTDPDNSQFEVDVTLDVITGIDEASKTAVMIYPNPTKDLLNINADAQIQSVDIYNLTGQLIKHQDVNAITHQVDMSTFQTGVYLVKVKMENGIVTHRISVK